MVDSKLASKGMQDILSKLDSDDLLGLASTVTHGLLRDKLQTREGAIEAILTYSNDYRSILRRKVLTRDILFSYLHDNAIPVKFPTTKSDLIDLIAKYWNLPPVNECIPRSPPDTIPQDDINTMAHRFAEWFCLLMNDTKPIGCEHFWLDSILKLHLIFGESTVSETIESNVEEITQKLFNVKNTHSLYFNPNLMSDGVQGRMDPHGLVVVLVCGTLHADNVCVGIFEQVFLLARDPLAENNWKIKKLELNLKSKRDVCALPRLCDGNLTSCMLSLPTS